MSADVKFDAVSGDYYPIIYFNDYWNLQKDYYPINESLASLPLRVSFCPLSLWRWQLYAAQSAKSPWNFLGDELYEQSDEEQDSVKVRQGWGLPWLQEGKGKWTALLAWGLLAGAVLPTVSQPLRAPPRGGQEVGIRPLALADTGGPASEASVAIFALAFLFAGAGPLGRDLPLLPHGLLPCLWAPTRGLCSLALCP